MDCGKMMGDHMGGGAAQAEGSAAAQDNPKTKGKNAMEGQGSMSQMQQDCMKMMDGKGGDMKMGGSMGAQATGTAHHGTGTVKSIDASAASVTLQHEAISSVGWPAMTMTFNVQDRKILDGIKPGQHVDFAFKQEGSRNVITSLK